MCNSLWKILREAFLCALLAWLMLSELALTALSLAASIATNVLQLRLWPDEAIQQSHEGKKAALSLTW